MVKEGFRSSRIRCSAYLLWLAVLGGAFVVPNCGEEFASPLDVASSKVAAGGYWDLDENEGTTIHDSLGTPEDGAFRGHPDFYPEWRTDHPSPAGGSYLRFDGDDVIEVQAYRRSELDISTDTIVLKAWVRTTQVVEGQAIATIVQRGMESTFSYGLGLTGTGDPPDPLNAGCVVGIVLEEWDEDDPPGIGFMAFGGIPVNTGHWVGVAFTFDPNNQGRVWINTGSGWVDNTVATNEGTATKIQSGTYAEVRIGDGGTDDAIGFVGDMDDVWVGEVGSEEFER